MKPQVISFYTPQYRGEVEEFRASCAQFGIQPFVDPVPDLGSWRKNVGQKPEYILSNLERMPLGHGVVWLDIDARLRREPTLLWELPDLCDFAAYFIPHNEMNRKHQPVPGEDGIASGTMFFHNTKPSIELLRQWVAREKGQHRYGQIVLGETWHLDRPTSLCTHRLPQAYCKVFDGKWKKNESGPPVIEHMQRSRRYRRKVDRRR